MSGGVGPTKDMIWLSSRSVGVVEKPAQLSIGVPLWSAPFGECNLTALALFLSRSLACYYHSLSSGYEYI